jgi:hypothetical protein
MLSMSKYRRTKTIEVQDKSANRQQTKVPFYLTAALFLIMGIYAISITLFVLFAAGLILRRKLELHTEG